MNLIDNAIKYTNSGFIEIGYTWGEQNLQLYVRDTGIGIDPKNQIVIFERFSQEEKEISKKFGGLGLGLSIAKSLKREKDQLFISLFQFLPKIDKEILILILTPLPMLKEHRNL